MGTYAYDSSNDNLTLIAGTPRARLNTMEADIASLKSALNKHTLDLTNYVVLTDSVDYTCTMDGYFRVSCDNLVNSYAQGRINGQLVMTAANSRYNAGSYYPSSCVFVHAGTTMRYNGANAHGYFYPLI